MLLLITSLSNETIYITINHKSAFTLMMVMGRKTHVSGEEWESLSVFKGGVFDNRYNTLWMSRCIQLEAGCKEDTIVFVTITLVPNLRLLA